MSQLTEIGSEILRERRARIEERGDQLLFYVKALAWTPRAVRPAGSVSRHSTGTSRCTA